MPTKTKIPEKVNCFVCSKKLKVMYRKEMGALMKKTPELHQLMVDGGNLFKITCGYGSSFDFTWITLAVCDDCLIKGKKHFLQQKKYF